MKYIYVGVLVLLISSCAYGTGRERSEDILHFIQNPNIKLKNDIKLGRKKGFIYMTTKQSNIRYGYDYRKKQYLLEIKKRF